MLFYAQLDEENTCIGIQTAPAKIDGKNLVEITEQTYRSDILGNRYDRGEWFPQPKPPIPHMASNAETLQALNNLYAELIISGVV